MRIPLRAALLAAVLAVPGSAQLKTSAAQRLVKFGAAVDPSHFSETAYGATLTREFSQVEPDTAMLFAQIHPAQSTYNFALGDQVVTFAQQYKMAVRGHSLVWYSQNPAWLTTGGLTTSQIQQTMQSHIATVMQHYAGKVYAWDVVDEAFNDDGTYRTSIWTGNGLQPDTSYIESAFRAARAADPAALLFYNDYNLEISGPKADAVYKMLQDFKARGVPIDGVGFEGHLTASYTQYSQLQANMQRFAALGLQIQITELDVRLAVDSSGNPTTPTDPLTQEQIYSNVVRSCLMFTQCTAVQTWGVTDKYSSVPTTYTGFGSALLFDSTYTAKQAYTGVNNAFLTAPAIIAGNALVDAASYVGGGVAPGEIVVLFGPTYGPAALQTAQLNTTTNLISNSLGNTQLVFDGVAAPMVYAVAGQISAIVPFEVAGQASTVMQLEGDGVTSNAVTVPVLTAKPSIFTLDQSGKGAGAILDAATYKPITSSNPAARGSTVLVYITGAGQTSPPGVDGLVSTGLPLPAVPGVIATIGGASAPVTYAGGAVGLVHGGIQLNIQVPTSISPGVQPITVAVAGQLSQTGVTISVK